MSLIKCKECGHQVSDKAKVCPNCGCPLEKENCCPECGQALSSEDKICPNCGCPVSAEPNKANAECKPKKHKTRFVVLGILAVIVIAVVVGYLSIGGIRNVLRKEKAYQLCLYTDDTSELNDPSGKRVCGARLIGGRTDPIHFMFTTKVKLFDKETDELYVSGSKAYTTFADYLDDKFEKDPSATSKGVPVTQKEEEGVIIYLIKSEKDNNTVEVQKPANEQSNGNWTYQTQTNAMTDETMNLASCNSKNTQEVSGYRSPLHLGLCNDGKNNFVMLVVDGGTLKQDGLPMAYVRFDKGEVEMYSVMANDATTHHIVNTGKFIKKLKQSKTCAIQIETEVGKTAAYEFDTEGLKWDYDS